MTVDARLLEVVTALKVQRVIVMDEDHEPKLASLLPDLEGRRGTLDGEDAAWFNGLNLKEPDDSAFRYAAGKWWDLISTERKRDIIARFARHEVEEGEHVSDSVTYSAFWEYWPRDVCPVEFLTPDEWDRGWREIFSREGTTLAVLDLRLGPNDPRGGAKRMRELSELQSGGRSLAVIFTNEARPGEETALWDKLVDEHNIPSNYGMVISKERMAKVDDFAQYMARAAMTSTAREVADIVARRYTALADSARVDFRKGLDGDVFQHVIVRASDSEGVHPQDTLFRLVDLFFRRARKTQMDQISVELAPYLDEMAALGKASGATDPLPRVKQLRSEELYTDYFGADRTALPPWLGDVWEVDVVGAEKQLFIHLGQPCDLMLRTDTGARVASYFLFAPLVRRAMNTSISLIAAPVPYLRIGTTVHDEHIADFKKVVIVDADLLDAIALAGPEFSAKRFADADRYEHVVPATKKRYKAAMAILRDQFRPALATAGMPGAPAAQVVAPAAGDATAPGEAPATPAGPPAMPRLMLTGTAREVWIREEAVVTVRAKRVLRLEGSHAMEVLHRYAWSLQRAAHDPEFAKKLA